MTLDYTKMFLIVTEEAVVKGHFTSAWADSQYVTHRVQQIAASLHSELFARMGVFLFLFVGFFRYMTGTQLLHGALQRVPGILPVGGRIAVVVFRDQPVQILLYPNHILKH